MSDLMTLAKVVTRPVSKAVLEQVAKNGFVRRRDLSVPDFGSGPNEISDAVSQLKDLGLITETETPVHDPAFNMLLITADGLATNRKAERA